MQFTKIVYFSDKNRKLNIFCLGAENVESSFIKKECKAEKNMQEWNELSVKEECKPEIKTKPPIDRCMFINYFD